MNKWYNGQRNLNSLFQSSEEKNVENTSCATKARKMKEFKCRQSFSLFLFEVHSIKEERKDKNIKKADTGI